MKDEAQKKTFLTYYIHSLGERSREEKRGTQLGFDWVIYNLGLAKGWSPIRLPFLRGADGETAKTKTEPEFGVDVSFLSADKTELFVFSLKDEVLNNRNWRSEGMDAEFRTAANVDLNSDECSKVRKVRIILGYNKDEDATGVALFNGLVKALPASRGEIEMRYERWNLTRVVDEVSQNLFSLELFPQKHYGQISYITSLFRETKFKAQGWDVSLVPAWKQFLDELFTGDKPDVRKVLMVPLVLSIILEKRVSDPTPCPGYIELTEIAALRIFDLLLKEGKKPSKKLKEAIDQFWGESYCSMLHQFYVDNLDVITAPHTFDKCTGLTQTLDNCMGGINAYWHIARIGLLGVITREVMTANEQSEEAMKIQSKEFSQWVIHILNNNEAAYRPVFDIHHVQNYLIFFNLCASGDTHSLAEWLNHLTSYLRLRSFRVVDVPFIEHTNSEKNLFQSVLLKEKPNSKRFVASIFVTQLFFLVRALPQEERDPVLESLWKTFLQGKAQDGPVDGALKHHLTAWMPPDDYKNIPLSERRPHSGSLFDWSDYPSDQTGEEITDILDGFAKTFWNKSVIENCKEEGILSSASILSSLHNNVPLNPRLWVFANRKDSEREE